MNEGSNSVKGWENKSVAARFPAQTPTPAGKTWPVKQMRNIQNFLQEQLGGLWVQYLILNYSMGVAQHSVIYFQREGLEGLVK